MAYEFSTKAPVFSPIVGGLGCSAQSASSDQDPTLSPVRSFDLRGLSVGNGVPFHVHGFRAHATGLYFLISRTFNTLNAEIVHTDYRGTPQKLIKGWAYLEMLDFDVDGAGAIYVLGFMHSDRDKAILLKYRSDGLLDKTTPAPATARSLSMVRNSPTIFALNGGNVEVVKPTDTKVVVSIPLVRPGHRLATAALPDGRLVVMEKVGATLHFVDPDRETVASFAPRVPALAWLATLRPGDAKRNVAFSAIAARSDGQLYLLISHYKLNEGAPVMYFHMNGNLPRTVRCSLPRFSGEETPNNPSGYMIAHFVGSGDGSSLVLASTNGKVAIYSL